MTAALLIGACAVAVCQYRYGIFDQGQYLVQVIGLENPRALAGDPYLEAFASLHSLFWPLVAALSHEAMRPAVCLAFTFLLAVMNAGLLVALGLRLVEPAHRRGVALVVVAAPALVLAVPKEQNWFGLVSVADIELTATLAVLPCVYGAMLAWINGRPRWSLVVAIIAVPIHGQTAAYLLAAWWIASAWTYRADRRWRRGLLAVALLGAAAVQVERSALAMPATMLDRYEAVGRALWTELIHPLSAPLAAWGGMLALVGLGIAVWMAPIRGRAPAETARRRLRTWALSTLAFPVVGLFLLAVGLRDPLLWRLMVGRSFMLIQIAALVAFAVWCVERAGQRGPLALGAVLALVFVTVWPATMLPVPVAGAALLLITLMVAGSALSRPRRAGWSSPRAAAAVALSMLALVAVAVHRAARPGFPLLRNGDDARWLEAQRWARQSTPPGTVFLTPPYLSGWRVESHRPTYGEVKDGGLLFYTGAKVLQWEDRMRRVGANDDLFWLETPGLSMPFIGSAAKLDRSRAGYRAALAAGIDDVVRERSVAYVVTEAAFDVPVGPLAWRNEAFVIRRAAGE